MRSIFAVSILAASAFAFSACTVSSADRGEDDSEIDTSETAGALSAYGKTLVGTFATTDAASPFDTIVLNKSGTYKTTENVQCFAAPCPAMTDFGKFIGYRPAFGGKIGGLRLISAKTGRSTYYRVVLSAANTSFQLYSNGQWFKYGKPAPKCDLTSTDTKKYVADKEMCARIRFVCEPGFQYFADDCGCGCEVSAPVEPYTGAGCERTGCSGQVCAEAGSGLMTTCEWKEQYACYATARCEKQDTGKCGWTTTNELEACLESHL